MSRIRHSLFINFYRSLMHMKKIKLVSDGGALFEVLLSVGSIKGKYYYRNNSPTCISHRPIR